jgi:hypothetical protein
MLNELSAVCGLMAVDNNPNNIGRAALVCGRLESPTPKAFVFFETSDPSGPGDHPGLGA